MITLYKVAIDNDFDGKIWWEHVHGWASETAPKEIRSLLQIGGPSYVVIDDNEDIIAWAREIPGWNNTNAPNSTKHPLYFVWVEE